MAVFKCKMCGGDLDVVDGMSVAECEYCGTKQTLPKLNDNEKDFETLLCKLMIQVICKHAVMRSSSVFVCFLVTNKYIKRFFILRYFEYAFLNIVDIFRFFFVD